MSKLSFIKKYLPLFGSILVFLILIFRYIGTLPYLDGSIDLVQINDFFLGGFKTLFENWASIHPPFKVMLGSLFFSIFGVKTISYSLIGIIFGSSSLVSMWFLVNKLFNRKVAIISVLLLSTTPLFLANSIYSSTDFMLAGLILLSLTFYIFNKKALLSVVLCISVMTKETAVLLPFSILLIEIIFALIKSKGKKSKFNLKKIFSTLLPIFLPLILFYVWLQFLNANNKGVWSDWVFTETSGKGSIGVILNNLITLSFLNKYAFQNWNQLLILNFNWVMFGSIIIGTIASLWHITDEKKKRILESIKNKDLKIKTLSLMAIFFFVYFLLVLSFQTYTITRYGLPLIPLALIIYSKYIYEFTKNRFFIKIATGIVIIVITFLSIFSSVDPVSIQLWGSEDINGQKLIPLEKFLAGNDGLVYNLQSSSIAKDRSDKAYQANERGTSIYSANCYWMLPDINNDKKLFTIFGLTKLKADCEILK